MIQLFTRDKIDTDRWDDCISQSPDGQIFAYSWYLDICCPGWMGLINDDYTSVFPLAGRNKFGVHYLYQPFFTRHFGLFSIHPSNAIERIEFLNAIPKKYRYWDFCLHTAHQESPEDNTGEKRIYQFIDLNQDYTTLSGRYHDNHIRNLRKAEKEGLKILPDYNPDIVVEHFKYHQKEKNLGFEEGDFKTLKRLMKISGKMSGSKCWAAVTQEGEVLAGAFFMESNQRIVYLKGFTTDKGKKIGAMHYIFDRLIRANVGKEIILDFGGSSVESVARFFKGFGASDSVYLHLRINRLPTLLRWLRN
ncbi:hypothetical protein BH11BAC2_BH11BAC2_23460 [soil metagenome]